MNEKMCKLLKIAQDIWAVLPSLPSRERGLKFFAMPRFPECRRVAPLAGAWIEIVRSSTGYVLAPSLPSRERGLKSHISLPRLEEALVAPLAGAWIEIKRQKMLSPLLLSLPSRERGLKFCILITIISI